ncbi:hypothetical protein [Bdellovibrio svalbardensis]|uniref:Uncharacterized protein n=1 Tax=Bdellovibrio svalbardensis TaxID=2972972 RepID=A0ABT6DL03_9BACT|nr:hypothetical protein [Bdellovibrio svalbardensis]MDG0815793.1 hypothetical protein [Bdellovibrio svalbardensis]
MKSVIFALVLSASPAFAAYGVDSSYNDDYQVDFISWCDQNNVMGQTTEGQVYVRENCSEKNMKCLAIKSGRFNHVLYTATCQPK